jgi:hypothetical protein
MLCGVRTGFLVLECHRVSLSSIFASWGTYMRGFEGEHTQEDKSLRSSAICTRFVQMRGGYCNATVVLVRSRIKKKRGGDPGFVDGFLVDVA